MPHKLNALRVEKIRKPGRYGDGLGLWLQVSPTGTKSWLFRFMLRGRSREMGLGPLHTISLAEARTAAQDARKLLLAGVDPIESKRARAAQEALQRGRHLTFKAAAEAYIEAQRAGWKNAKHAAQWETTLETYAYPTIGAVAVSDIDTALVLRCVEPIWKTKTETAARLRGRIESILSWATVRGHRQGDNPARWRGHLQELLPERSKVRAVEHHPALPYSQIGAFMAALRAQPGVSARALEFCILTATRTGEVLGAVPAEIDLSAKLWTIPGARTKTRKEHRVPLSPRAIEILREVMPDDQAAYVFPNRRNGRPLSGMALLMTLRRMERNDLTVHGFRSTFRDWAAEMTAYPHEVAEMALGHAVGDKVEAAYRRGDLLAKRVRIMADWAAFCARQVAGSKVVPLRKS